MVKMIYRVVVFFVLTMVSVSCQHKKEDRNALRTFIIENFQENKLDVNEVVTEMTLLPLKLDSGQLIGQIKDICFMGDTAYLLDAITASIYSFDMKNGKCISSICKRGNGPNEYINPIALSTDSKKLYVLDMPTSRIIEFDKDLNAVNNWGFEFPAFDFIAVDTGFLLYNMAPTDDLSKYVHINKKGKCINSFVSVDKNRSSGGYVGGGGKCFLKNEDGKVFASESYCSQIYEWENDSLKPIYQIDFKDLNLPMNIDKNNVNLFEEPYAFMCNFFVMSDLFIPSFFYKSKRYYGFFSISGDNQKVGLMQDSLYNIPFFPQWQNKRQLIGACQYESVAKYFSEKNKKSDVECFEPENPVLVICSFL